MKTCRDHGSTNTQKTFFLFLNNDTNTEFCQIISIIEGKYFIVERIKKNYIIHLGMKFIYKPDKESHSMHTEVRNIKYVNIATCLFKLVSYLSVISCNYFVKGTSPRDFQG